MALAYKKPHKSRHIKSKQAHTCLLFAPEWIQDFWMIIVRNTLVLSNLFKFWESIEFMEKHLGNNQKNKLNDSDLD